MRVIAAGAAVVLMVLAIFIVRPAPIAELDSRACDVLARWAGPGTQSARVTIVGIDEKSLERFGRWPWPRDLVARLAQSVLDQGAAAVALDMMFPQEDGGNDKVLADAISGKPLVVGYALKFDGDAVASPCPVPSLPLAIAGASSGGAAFFHAAGAIGNAPAVSAAASSSGFLNAVPDRDGTVRHVPLIIECGGRYYASLSLAALNLYRHVPAMQLAIDPRGAWRLRLDRQVISLEAQSELRLRFRGGRRSLPYISASDVLNAHAGEELLRGRIALVGGSAAGMQNPVVTALDPIFPEIEVQATAIDNLLQGDTFYRPVDARVWELTLALAAGAISTFLLARLRFLWGTLATFGLIAGVLAGCLLLLASSGALFSPLPAAAALACNLPALTLLHYVREKQRADRIQQQLLSARQQSLETLRESESRYRRLVENVNDAIVMDDVAGRLVFASRRFREWFGLEEGDTSNILLEHYVAPEWRAQVRDRHDRRMRGEAVPDRFEFEGIRRDGGRIWIEALIANVEEGGRIVGSQAALRDATERKRIEAQYLQAQKMESIGRLAGGVAHDFNNLLTVINGYSGLLLAQMRPDDKLWQGLEEIRKAGERAAELTQKMLAFSRKQAVRPKPLNLNLVVNEAKKMLERVIGEDIELVTLLSPDLALVTADPSQIHQILMNLVINARDAMPHGGKLTVDTRNCSDAGTPSICLGVSDSGTGMTEEVKLRIFEPFFTTKDEGKGTGLGLATVYGIVHQNGGRIEVTSTLGHGTSFHIYLPRTQPSLLEQPAASDPAPALRGSETVLIVEDQDAVRELARIILESYGYRVMHASNGPDAIALAAGYAGIIHLLMTDIILPVMDGRVLAEQLTAVRPETKVLYVSGYSEERIGSGKSLQADSAYLSKPFTSEVLARRVREILAGGDTQRKAAQME
jgi:PAS domain S-box-containing protein